MSAADLAIVILSVVSVLTVGALVAVLFVVTRAVTDLRRSVDELHDEVVPLVRDLEASSERVVNGLERADGLLDRADEVSARADTLSRVTYQAIADPVIKTTAVLKGAGAMGRRLRGRRAQAAHDDVQRREVG
ncbi:MAG: hypothetical protein RIE08_16755 [Acidimicrobiales bacterium]